jgi:outer membrane receptor protein involved in Fe transport
MEFYDKYQCQERSSKMRAFFILIIIIAFSYPFSMPGQEQTVDVDKLKQKKVYLNAENLSLEKVILSLSESLKLKIIYRSDAVKKIKINMELVWIPFEQALQKLLYPHNLTYFFTPDGTVIIASSSQEQWSMTGKITDSKTGEPLAGVNVYVENTSLGCATDKDGSYQIYGISPGVHRLVVRMMGYKEIKEYIFHEGKKIVRQNFSLEQETLQMQEIQVVAKREKVILKREVSRFSIKPRNISMIPSHGEMDIFRTIQLLPGVVMTSEFKSQLYIRGGNSDQNLVLLDGGIIYNPFHFSGILSAFDVDAIDEVDFFAGGFQSEYGSRLSSVVDIKTRKGADKFSGRLNISPISVKSMIEGPIWSWGNYLFTGRKSYVSGTAKKMGGSVEPEFYDGIGRIEVRPTWRDRIIISSFFGKDSVRLRDENRTKGIKSENISSAFNYHRNFCDWFNTSLRATYGEFKTEVPQPLNKDEPQKNAMEDRSYDFKMELTLSDGFSFKVGANYHEIRVKYKSADPIIPEIKIDKRLFESAFFIQNYMKVKEKWIFETGLRMTRYDESMPFIFEPRFNVQYNRYNFLTLKGAYGRFSQNLVTIYNENDNYNPVDIWLPPDPDLPIATADHLILGCSYHTIDLIISAETYWKKYYHLTHYNRERISPEDPFFVQGKGYGLGLDLSLQLIKEKWQLWMSYSLAKAKKELPVQFPEPGTEKFAPRYDRRHNLNLSFEYQFATKLIGSIRFNLGSGLPFSFMTGGYYRWSTWVIDQTSDYITHHPDEQLYYLTAIKSKRDAFRFPVYHRLDVSLKYNLKIGYFKFKSYIQIINLYNQPNVLYYDMKGKPYKSLPILPMAGLEIVM